MDGNKSGALSDIISSSIGEPSGSERSRYTKSGIEAVPLGDAFKGPASGASSLPAPPAPAQAPFQPTLSGPVGPG